MVYNRRVERKGYRGLMLRTPNGKELSGVGMDGDVG